MPVQVPKTRCGGIADDRFRPSGFFRVGECDAVFWLVDPDGCRFTYPPPIAVINAAGHHLDAISFNCFGLDQNGAIGAYAGTAKRCLIGEFSYRSADSGLPNTEGAGPQVATQAERAEGKTR